MKIIIYPKLRYATLMLFSAILFTSCDKDKDEPKDSQEPDAATKTVVYAAGLGSSGDNLVGVRYWKDGEIVPINADAYDCMVTGIHVSDGDVYVVGSERTDGYYTAKYWKNGVDVNLSDGSKTAFGHAIFVDKGDVYVSGGQYEPVLSTTVKQAKYWKNGVAHNLSEISAHRGTETTSIVIDGNDVYVAGYERNGSFDVAKYWKNGESHNLSAGTSNADATGIAVINGNVHVSGHEFIDGILVPTYWLNGVPTRLSNPGVGYWTNGMAIASNGDVYILVRENGALAHVPDKIGYWKVGQSSIEELTSGDNHGAVYGITADGNDLYVVGSYRFDGGPSSACIWKNGEISQLPTGGSSRSEAVGIFLAKEPI